MTLQITSTATLGIIDHTGLPVLTDYGERHLKHEMNDRLPALLAAIVPNPIRGTVRLREQIRNVESAVRRLLSRLGYERHGQAGSGSSHEWPPSISALIYARDDEYGTICERLNELTNLLFWLKAELTSLDINVIAAEQRKAPNAALYSTVAVRQFCWDLLPVYTKLFGRRPAASYTTTRKAGPQPTGPTFRYLTAILIAVRNVLNENDLEEIARDRGLNPSDETIQKWIRRFLELERKRRSSPDVTPSA